MDEVGTGEPGIYWTKSKWEKRVAFGWVGWGIGQLLEETGEVIPGSWRMVNLGYQVAIEQMAIY